MSKLKKRISSKTSKSINNFTKEELKKLLEWRNNVIYRGKPTKEIINSNAKLSNKIEAIIDNYDEHTQPLYDESMLVSTAKNENAV